MMASENNAVQITVVTRTAEEVDARVAAIKANGGTLISVRIVKPPDGTGTFEVEVKHT